MKRSDFVQHSCSVCDFDTTEPWVILSPIEMDIKKKIETIGTRLKDWNIRINYGIKTGYNEAFIIDSAKRDEILANCRTEDERTRTAELIRPILRGRDIKRYGYEWGELYLIATFPSRHYDIELYPAVKEYLLSFAKESLIESGYQWVADDYLEDFCKQKIEQTGSTIEIQGKHIKIGNHDEKSRKKTNNKWFETQDSIGYWEDFFKPKIVWGNLNKTASYSIAGSDFFINAPSPLLVPASKYLLAILNSKLADYYIRTLGVVRNGGYFEYKPMFIEKLPVPIIDKCNPIYQKIEQMVNAQDYVGIDHEVYNLFKLNKEEINYIDSL